MSEERGRRRRREAGRKQKHEELARGREREMIGKKKTSSAGRCGVEGII